MVKKSGPLALPKPEFRLFPNPISSQETQIHLEIGQNNLIYGQEIVYQIIDPLGCCVFQGQSLNQNSLNLSLPKVIIAFKVLLGLRLCPFLSSLKSS